HLRWQGFKPFENQLQFMNEIVYRLERPPA
ncbi:MAG: hypothetical protein HW408_1629, partial [Actinobacteria bacterium]|nr:hypothetical protein [Actinomycetota bacterium]